MREIKFRAWNANRHKMIYGVEDIMAGCLSDWGDSLMQYTGLQDKNGKEIYEGDILKEHFGGFKPEMSFEFISISHDNIFEAKIPDLFFQMGGQFQETFDEELEDYTAGKFFEVIGNIYENPELLKAED